MRLVIGESVSAEAVEDTDPHDLGEAGEQGRRKAQYSQNTNRTPHRTLDDLRCMTIALILWSRA